MLWQYFAIISQCNIGFINAEECTKLSTCSCECDGKTIDLKDLASKKGPKYKDYESTQTGDVYKYSYNPCEPFTETDPSAFEDHCQSVAACQVIDTGGSFQFYDTGTQDSVKFLSVSGREVELDTDDTVVVAQYESQDGGRKTDVVLRCKDGDTAFEAYGELSLPTPTYRFILSSPYCCFEKSGLSAGSVLLIIAVVLLVVYTIFGVVYNAARNNARGGALFTHVLVIKAFPGLVKDGCLFICTRGKRSSYDTVK